MTIEVEVAKLIYLAMASLDGYSTTSRLSSIGVQLELLP